MSGCGTLRRLARSSDRSGVEVKSEVAGRLSKCTGFIMEIIGRRWTITYCFAGAIPGLALMVLAHRTGDYATVAMSAGAIITGLTVLSSFTAVRIYLSEQFPTALRGRGYFFGETIGRIFSGVLMPHLLEPYTDSATIFFGTIAVVVSIDWQPAPASRCCSARKPSASSKWSPRRRPSWARRDRGVAAGI
jgi:MFS family permease